MLPLILNLFDAISTTLQRPSMMYPNSDVFILIFCHCLISFISICSFLLLLYLSIHFGILFSLSFSLSLSPTQTYPPLSLLSLYPSLSLSMPVIYQLHLPEHVPVICDTQTDLSCPHKSIYAVTGTAVSYTVLKHKQ